MLVNTSLCAIIQNMDSKQAIPTFLQPVFFLELIMASYILNIGLNKSARYGKRYRGKSWQHKQALRRFEKYNLCPVAVRFVKGIGKEDLLIIKIKSGDNETKVFNKIYALSGSLKQNFIAVYDVDILEYFCLICRQTNHYGKFNIKFFRFK